MTNNQKLIQKLKNEMPRDCLDVHELYNDYVHLPGTDILLAGMPLVGVCHDIRHKYDNDDCALVFYSKKDDNYHWIHITGNTYRNLIELESE